MKIVDRVRKPGSPAVDVGLALLLAGLELYTLNLQRGHFAMTGRPVAPAVALILVATLPVALRRKFPFGAGLVVGVATLLLSTFDVPSIRLGGSVVLYNIADIGTTRQRRVALAILSVAMLVGPISEGTFESLPKDLAMYGGAFVLGSLVRARREHTEEVEQRADALEREAEAVARLAVAEERSRIARELHDVVAHGLGVIVVQSEAARTVLPDDPTEADRALQQIQVTGRESLVEMRRLLDLLREDEDNSLAPQPHLGMVPDLVQRLGQSGVEVDVETRGAPRRLSHGVELNAFRLIQESLTNVLKHAGASRATVTMEWGGDHLIVAVVDDGDGKCREDGKGHGIAGMRERVTMLGGTFAAGPRPSGGFEVRACLPLANGA